MPTAYPTPTYPNEVKARKIERRRPGTRPYQLAPTLRDLARYLATSLSVGQAQAQAGAGPARENGESKPKLRARPPTSSLHLTPVHPSQRQGYARVSF
ncbi:hypothetical protein FPOAC2_11151 [Fusarium poae]